MHAARILVEWNFHCAPLAGGVPPATMYAGNVVVDAAPDAAGFDQQQPACWLGRRIRQRAAALLALQAERKPVGGGTRPSGQHVEPASHAGLITRTSEGSLTGVVRANVAPTAILNCHQEAAGGRLWRMRAPMMIRMSPAIATTAPPIRAARPIANRCGMVSAASESAATPGVASAFITTSR